MPPGDVYELIFTGPQLGMTLKRRDVAAFVGPTPPPPIAPGDDPKPSRASIALHFPIFHRLYLEHHF